MATRTLSNNIKAKKQPKSSTAARQRQARTDVGKNKVVKGKRDSSVEDLKRKSVLPVPATEAHQHEHRRRHSIESSLVSRLLTRKRLDVQVDAIQELQNRYAGTSTGKALASISLLGSGKVVLVVLTLFFWWLRPNTWGPTRAASLVLSLVGVAKALFKGPRPYWLSQKLKALDPTLEVSFGFPSGHTAAVAATYGFLAFNEGVNELFLALLILVIVGISRVFTAAHFFHDVAGGALLGLTVLAVLVVLDKLHFGHYELGLISLFLSLSTLMIVVSQYGVKSIPFKLVQEGLSGSGFLLGLSLCHLSEEYVRVSLDSKRGSLPLVACAGGLAGIIIINSVIKSMHKHDDNLSLAGVAVCCVLYALINLWALWMVPLLVDDYLLERVIARVN